VPPPADERRERDEMEKKIRRERIGHGRRGKERKRGTDVR
jgi:hypothetical protein